MHRNTTIFTLVLLSALLSRADYIYDVSFEPPIFTNGAGITSGPGSDTPSFTTGDPTAIIATGMGSFTSQLAYLNNGGQMRFDAPVGVYSTGIHRIAFDATMMDVGSGGTSVGGISIPDIGGVAFDTGSMRVGSVGNTVTLPYVVGDPSAFSFIIDLDTDVYSAWVDGSNVLNNISFGSSLGISEIFMAPEFLNPGASMGADNVQWEIVPEASTAMLLVVGGLGCLLFRRK